MVSPKYNLESRDALLLATLKSDATVIVVEHYRQRWK